MARIVAGPKGSGKTKQMIDLANDSAAESKGEIVFINDREKYRSELNNSVRYVNIENFNITSPDVFLGFLSGLIAENYDIHIVYIDNVLRIVKKDNINELEDLFSKLKPLESKYSVEFVLSICSEEKDLPSFMQ
ncbi:MAG: hypothetical protein HGA49_06545 [Eubacteriaceae bacterium]|nr:hypothetical protein [Eubacteriaceae bacterium]